MDVIGRTNEPSRTRLAMQVVAAAGENASRLFKACVKKPVEEPKYLLKFLNLCAFGTGIREGINTLLTKSIHKASRFLTVFDWPGE